VAQPTFLRLPRVEMHANITLKGERQPDSVVRLWLLACPENGLACRAGERHLGSADKFRIPPPILLAVVTISELIPYDHLAFHRCSVCVICIIPVSSTSLVLLSARRRMHRRD
jgi:hypothetical protein